MDRPTSKFPDEPLSFVLQHVLGLDELGPNSTTPLIQLRKQNLQKFQDNIEDSFVGKLVSSLGYKHRLIPSGSTFENLMLPHVNNLLFSEDGPGEGNEGFVSDLDIMCAFKDLTVHIENHVKNVCDQTPPDSQAGVLLCETNFPRYYTLKASINPSELQPPGMDMFLIEDVSKDYFLSCKKFSNYFHELGIKYFTDNPHEFHDKSPPEKHGPSLCIPIGLKNTGGKGETKFRKMLSEDIVWSLNCDWPDNALSWAGRPRAGDWLSETVIQEMIEGKCNLVPSPPPPIEGVNRDLLWRLSFSLAEVRLSKQITWIPRKCYMLLKALHFTHFSKPKGLSTYHLKTALFWLLDEEPLEMFTSEHLLACFRKLINKALSFLRARNWPNYFIPENNMVSNVPESALRALEDKIVHVNENLLVCLEECQTVLVSSESFPETYATVLELIQSGETDKSKMASAYIDTLLSLGNFYLITVDVNTALPYFEQAFDYASEAISENPEGIGDVYEDLLKMLCDHSVEIGDIERAIAYLELRLKTFDGPKQDDEMFSATLANLGCLYNIKHAKEAHKTKMEIDLQPSDLGESSEKRGTSVLRDRAVEYFVKSVTCPSVSALSHVEFANFLYCNEKFRDALKHLQRALESLQDMEDDSTAVTSETGGGKAFGEAFQEKSVMSVVWSSEDTIVRTESETTDFVGRAVVHSECQQVISHGDLERNVVDDTIRGCIEREGQFHAPANVYARYLTARCLQHLGQRSEAVGETSRIHAALRTACEVYGKSYMSCAIDIAKHLCKDLGSVKVLSEIEVLQSGLVSSSESFSDSDEDTGVRYRMLPTALPSAQSADRPFGGLGQVLQSHLVVDRDQVLPKVNNVDDSESD